VCGWVVLCIGSFLGLGKMYCQRGVLLSVSHEVGKTNSPVNEMWRRMK
jgi:hypothetical protein